MLFASFLLVFLQKAFWDCHNVPLLLYLLGTEDFFALCFENWDGTAQGGGSKGFNSAVLGVIFSERR